MSRMKSVAVEAEEFCLDMTQDFDFLMEELEDRRTQQGGPLQQVIGFAGRKGSGKSTAAELLVREYGFTHINFADPIKDALLAVNPMVAGPYGNWALQEFVDIQGWDRIKDWPGVRGLLQRFGTEFGRDMIDKDIWINLWTKRARETGGRIVVSDVRFPNELLRITELLGGEVYRVRRPALKEFAPTEEHREVNAHSSETLLDAIPLLELINNDDDIEGLHQQVRKIIEKQEPHKAGSIEEH